MKKVRISYDDSGAVRDQYLCVRTTGTIFAESLLRKMTFKIRELPTGERIRVMLTPPNVKRE